MHWQTTSVFFSWEKTLDDTAAPTHVATGYWKSLGQSVYETQSESTFVGAGIGAALGGMRPIVEVMTINFSLLALDQIVNNAAILSAISAYLCVKISRDYS